MLGKCTIYPWHAVMGTDLGIGNSFHPTKESIHLRVGFACFFSHSCGFFRVKLHGSNWWQNEFPSKTWRCCWCWDVVGAFLLLVLKLKHQMVWKNSNVHILYHSHFDFPKRFVFPECQKSVFQPSQKFVSFLATMRRGICQVSAIDSWCDHVEISPIHAPRVGSWPKTLGFPVWNVVPR